MVASGWMQACQKPPVETLAPGEAPAPPAVTPATAPAVKPIMTATPAPDLVSPPGIFFLMQKASITTDAGIVGLKPGQLLREVGPDLYEVDGQRIALRPSQVTNNLRIARELASADYAVQAALRGASREKLPTPVATPAARATPPTTRSATAAASPQASATPSPIEVPKLGAGTGFADPEYGNRKNAKMDKSGRLYWRDSHGAIRYDF